MCSVFKLWGWRNWRSLEVETKWVKGGFEVSFTYGSGHKGEESY